MKTPDNLAIEIHLVGRAACRKCGDWQQDIEVVVPLLGGAKFSARTCITCLPALISKQAELHKLRSDLLSAGASREVVNRAIRAEMDGEGAMDPN